MRLRKEKKYSDILNNLNNLSLEEKQTLLKNCQERLKILDKKSSKYAHKIFDSTYSIMYMEKSDLDEIDAFKSNIIFGSILNIVFATIYAGAIIDGDFVNRITSFAVAYGGLEIALSFVNLFFYSPILLSHYKNKKLDRMTDETNELKSVIKTISNSIDYDNSVMQSALWLTTLDTIAPIYQSQTCFGLKEINSHT